jgi:hypothetical protein
MSPAPFDVTARAMDGDFRRTDPNIRAGRRRVNEVAGWLAGPEPG